MGLTQARVACLNMDPRNQVLFKVGVFISGIFVNLAHALDMNLFRFSQGRRYSLYSQTPLINRLSDLPINLIFDYRSIQKFFDLPNSLI